MVQNEKAFDELVANQVASTLQEVLGETAGQALLFHLGPLGNELDPKGLASNLEKVLGAGSLVIEKLILRNLFRTVGTAMDEARQADFAESVARMRDDFTRGKEEA